MTRRKPDPVVLDKPIIDLMEPFGYGEIAWFPAGLRLVVDLLLICHEPLSTAAEVRAYFHTRAVEALNCLEANGYQIFESVVTVKGSSPMECNLRIEVAEPR